MRVAYETFQTNDDAQRYINSLIANPGKFHPGADKSYLNTGRSCLIKHAFIDEEHRTNSVHVSVYLTAAVEDSQYGFLYEGTCEEGDACYENKDYEALIGWLFAEEVDNLLS